MARNFATRKLATRVDYLPRGGHQIEIKSKIRYAWNQSDSLAFNKRQLIPFWKE